MSGYKLPVTYYGDISIEPLLRRGQKRVFSITIPEISRDFRLQPAPLGGREPHCDHFSGQVSMATILQDFYLFRRDFHLRVRDHLPDEG